MGREIPSLVLGEWSEVNDLNHSRSQHLKEMFEDTKRQSEAVNRRRTDNTMVKKYQRGNQKP